MEKYKTEFKLKIVKSFLAGDGGAKLLARRWTVPEEKIRTWVSRYRLHGIDGLRPKLSAYSSEFKLQVLSHQDRERLSSRRVAAIYDIRNPIAPIASTPTGCPSFPRSCRQASGHCASSGSAPSGLSSRAGTALSGRKVPLI